MKLDKLPSIIAKSRFNKKGFTYSDSGLLVPAYVASDFGFYDSGRDELKRFYSELLEVGVLALCPFQACREYLDFSRLKKCKTERQKFNFWDRFNKIVGPINYGELMPRSKLMIALLEGHCLDDGACAEIGHYATKYQGKRPIFGIRTDVRGGENPATSINPAVRYFLDQGPYNNHFFENPNARQNALIAIADFVEGLLVS
jgi:hypothetical protein